MANNNFNKPYYKKKFIIGETEISITKFCLKNLNY